MKGGNIPLRSDRKRELGRVKVGKTLLPKSRRLRNDAAPEREERTLIPLASAEVKEEGLQEGKRGNRLLARESSSHILRG